MRKITRLIALVCFPAALLAQEGSLSATLKGVVVEFAAKLEPGNADVRFPGSVTVGKDAIVHHQIRDRQNRREFGYDLRLDRMADSQTVRLTVAPLTVVSTERGWTMLGLSKYPVITAHIGETVALDLLVNPATGQKIVEYLTVRRSQFEMLQASGAPRDFVLSDVELTLQNPRVWVNGTLEPATAHNSSGISAHVLWLYLPQGAFEVSLWPDSEFEFQKAGVTAAKILVFHEGSVEYRVESTSQIAPGGGLYNVYVLRDPDWGPGKGEAGFALGGADKARALSMRKR